MDRVALICERMEQLSQVLPGENVEFDDDGSVHIVRGWRRWARRKVHLGGSRHSIKADLLKLLELSNDVASGLLGAPRVRCDCLDVGVHGRNNDDDNDGNVDDDGRAALIVDSNGNTSRVVAINSDEKDVQTVLALRERFFSQCDGRKRDSLQRLAAGLQGMCKAINTLMTSTYVEDADICGSLMKLINYAALQRQRIADIIGT